MDMNRYMYSNMLAGLKSKIYKFAVKTKVNQPTTTVKNSIRSNIDSTEKGRRHQLKNADLNQHKSNRH